MRCANPDCGREAKRKGLCDACYLYARRHKGAMRPESVIVASGQRALERELASTSGWALPLVQEAEYTEDHRGDFNQSAEPRRPAAQRFVRRKLVNVPHSS